MTWLGMNPPSMWWWLTLIVLLCAVLGGAWYRVRLARALDATGTLLERFSVSRLCIKTAFMVLAILSLLIAVLHPGWGNVYSPVVTQGRDVFIALDVSRSMLARDVAPDRLSVAKQAIKRLMDELPADRVALVLFSEKAHVHCPLTTDRELMGLFLDTLDHHMIAAGTTRLDEPIALVIAQCQRTPRKSRLLVLITDGEDFSHALPSIAQRAAQERLAILVVGVGTARGAPIPLYGSDGAQQGFVKDQQRVVVSQLNEDALRTLAHQTGGQAVFITQQSWAIQPIVDAILRAEKEQQERGSFATLQEQYPWFVGVAFLCLLIEWVL